MTGLFQALGDFIEFLLNPIYGIILYFVEFIDSILRTILVVVCQYLSYFISAFCSALGWVADRFLVNVLTGLTYLFPNGILSSNSSPNTSFVTQIINNGLVGVTWLKNFIDAGKLVAPIVTYIGFLLVWSIYKFVKSWIPFVGH